LPIYTYKCQDCGADLEKRQGYDDARLTTCERCGGRLRRTLHSVGIIFKGSGFYNTDNRGANAANGAKKDGATDGGKEGAKGDTKTDEKPKTEAGSTPASSGSTSPSSDGGAAKESPAPTKSV
jgi:putative FmdB family regulatory protein